MLDCTFNGLATLVLLYFSWFIKNTSLVSKESLNNNLFSRYTNKNIVFSQIAIKQLFLRHAQRILNGSFLPREINTYNDIIVNPVHQLFLSFMFDFNDISGWNRWLFIASNEIRLLSS